MSEQIRSLKRGVHIIVATPGRLLDLMERKTVSLSTVHNIVMDEADEMLNMGFTDSINAILADVPKERNTLLFSATMSPEIARISKNYLQNAKEITIGRKNESTSNVKHVAYTVQAKDKYAALKRIVDYYPQIYGIIFCRTRKETQEIADKLMQEGYNADSLHGELSQDQRDAVMDGVNRPENLNLFPADINGAGGSVIGAEQSAHDLRPACADKTGKAEDFTLMQRKRNVVQLRFHGGQMLHPENLLTDRRAALWVVFRQVTANHQLDQRRFVGVFCVERLDILAIAHDGDAVRNLKQFFETVRDINN